MQGPFTKDRSRKVLVSYWRQGDFATSGVPVRAAQLATATRTRTGYSNRNHRQQIRAHSNAGTIMDGVLTSIDFQRGGAEMAYRWPLNVNSDQVKREKVWGDLSMTTVNFVTFNPIDSPNPEAAIRASAAAYQQIRKAQVAVSGPTFLGEAREAIRMLKRPAAGLQDLARDWLDTCKRRKKANPKSWLKNIGSAWLEHSFGWLPLLADARDAAKAWNLLFDEERLIPFSAFGVQTTDRGSTTVSTGVTLSYMWYLHNRFETSTKIVKIRGLVRASAKTGGRAQLELFGFTPSEFIPTAWELLPWSFLIDYFSNIGDIISAGVTDTSGVAWINRSISSVYSLKVISRIDADKSRLTSIGTDDFLFADGRPSLVHWQRRTVNRLPNFSLTVPDLYFTLPGSDKQLLNVAALLSQARALHPQR